jgi:chromosome segregation ATPase
MMSASIPPSSATDVVHALLRIIGDPGSANEKLQQLIKEGQAAQSRWDEANALLARLASERAAFKQEMSDAHSKLDEMRREADQRLVAADRREQSLANADARLQAAEQRLAQVDLEVASRSQMLSGINATLAALREKL